MFLKPLLLLLTYSASYASILPPNDLKLPLSKTNEGLTEVQYNAVIDKVMEVYRPVIEKKGKKLVVNKLWESPTVNAGTYRNGNEWIFNLYGGYARHPLITEDSYALVLCHELGHHLGGAPRKEYQSGRIWSSTEGQADYFATLKCLRQVFGKEDNIAAIANLEVPTLVAQKCSSSFPTDWEKALCIRTTLAGISTANLSADIRKTEQPLVDTPDSNYVERTFNGHPVPQCRLDTYFMGSVCEVSSYENVSEDDEAKGTCHEFFGHKDGLRPRCWFAGVK